jgi:hypothetical protein
MINKKKKKEKIEKDRLLFILKQLNQIRCFQYRKKLSTLATDLIMNEIMNEMLNKH